ncbi:MAG TPA: hypothetical protein VGB74_07825 [Actinoplanes sp.]|jgi:hypothetical protein
MRTPRLAGLGLTAMAAAAFAVAGCDNGGADPSASGSGPATAPSSASADPAAVSALAAATAKLGTTSFKILATSGTSFKLSGAVDPATRVGTADLTASGTNTELKVKSLLLDKDLYVQVPGVTKAGTWTHLDVARLPEGANVGLRPGQVDPVNTANLLASSTDVHSTGGNNYAGTLDVSKAIGLAGVDQVTVDSYGAQAQNVPFTAGIDEQGRLSVLMITPPSTGSKQILPIEVLYTDYGVPVTATRPAASQITEAPADLYTSLGG